MVSMYVAGAAGMALQAGAPVHSPMAVARGVLRMGTASEEVGTPSHPHRTSAH